MILIILGALFVGILQCVVPFLEKIPLTVLTPMQFIILKVLLGFVPIILITSFIFMKKKHNCNFYNKKVILITVVSFIIAMSAYYCYTYLIKMHSPGLIMPIILSSVVIMTLFFDHFFFKREIHKRDILCIILIAVSIYFLCKDNQYSEDSMKYWIDYLKK